MDMQDFAKKIKSIVDGAYKAFWYDVNTTIIYENEMGMINSLTPEAELEMPRVTVKKDGTDRVTVKKDGTSRVTASIEIHLMKPDLGYRQCDLLQKVEESLMDADIIVVDGYLRQDDVFEFYLADGS